MIHLTVTVDVVSLNELDKLNGHQERNGNQVIVEDEESDKLPIELSLVCLPLKICVISTTLRLNEVPNRTYHSQDHEDDEEARIEAEAERGVSGRSPQFCFFWFLYSALKDCSR